MQVIIPAPGKPSNKWPFGAASGAVARAGAGQRYNQFFMSYTVLARKYRPQRFSDVIGQDHVTRTLKNALEQQRIAHGYIFSGHRGIGKTTIARILAMALNCRSADHPVAEPCGVCDSCREIREGSVGAMDVIEIDAATNRGIDEVRGVDCHRNRRAGARPLPDFHPRRSPPGHRRRIQCPAEDARRASAVGGLHDGHDAARGHPADHPFALPALQLSCRAFSRHRRAIARASLDRKASASMTTHSRCWPKPATARCATRSPSWTRQLPAAARHSPPTWFANLVGTVNATVLEQVMTAVHDNNSEEVLRIIDKLLVEGQSPVHFARQLVRFLRNALVAKVAGPGSPLLQISSDEQARVARIAALFGEEDLTRFLQIMLRTHGDVSYKQEQRFHLELGLLKLVHAQRLLPLEQLLSESSLPAGGRTGTAASALASARSPVTEPERLSPELLPELLPALLPMTDPSARLRSNSTARAEAAAEAGDERASSIASLPAAQHAGSRCSRRAGSAGGSPLDGPVDLERFATPCSPLWKKLGRAWPPTAWKQGEWAIRQTA